MESKTLRRVGWMAAGLGLALVAAELATRIYITRFAPEEAFRRFASIREIETSERFPQLMIRHPYLGYALRPGYVRGENRINADGFRGEEIPEPKPEGEYRIVCLGASTTYGASVADPRLTYPGRLEHHLRARAGEHVRVINAGVPGYTSWETLGNFLFKALDLDPDLVVVYHGYNDIRPRLVWPPSAYKGDNSAFRTTAAQVFWPPLYEHSDLLRALAVSLGYSTPHGRLERLFGGIGAAYVGGGEVDTGRSGSTPCWTRIRRATSSATWRTWRPWRASGASPCAS